LCRFQGGREPRTKASKTERDDYCPAAEVLTAIHGVGFIPRYAYT